MHKLSLTLHLWLGLIAALFLFVEGVTGGLMAWGPEIVDLLNAGPRQAQPAYHANSSGPSLSLARLVPKLQQAESGLHLRMIRFAPTPKDADVAEFSGNDGTATHVWFDPSTGDILGARTTVVRHAWLLQLARWAARFHGDLPATVALLLIASTGLILWWPRRLFALRGPFAFERTNYQVHATVGFYASLLLLVFAATGVIMSEQRLALRLANWITHAPEPPPIVQQTRQAERRSTPLDLDEAFALAREDRPSARSRRCSG